MATAVSQSPSSQAAETAQRVYGAPVQAEEVVTLESEMKKKGNKVYFTIPEKNLLGWDHPGFGINLQHYAPGTHLVDQLIAEELERRSKVYNDGLLALLQPQVNRLVQAKLASSIG